MGKAFSLTPKLVRPVETRFRRIVTEIPAPPSQEILQIMRGYEPTNMLSQPPIVWDRAQGVRVHDRLGNTWLD